MSVLLARHHWTMRNDVSVENRNSHFSQVEEKHTISIQTISSQSQENNASDNLTGSSTVLKLEWTEVRSGGSAHQLISKDNNDQAARSQFQELGHILC